MHPTLSAFADRYRHAFPDLVIRSVVGKGILVCEWQEGPQARSYEVMAYAFPDCDWMTFRCSEISERSFEQSPLSALVASMDHERWLRGPWSPILAAPGTFGALVLERRLLGARPQSPDRLN